MSTDTAELTLLLPADTRFVSAARTAAASLAVEIDFSVDDIADLRIAVDELLTLMVEAEPSDERVTVVYAIHDDLFEMRASVVDRTRHDGVDALTDQILRSVVDEFTTDATGCTLSKRRSPR